MYESIYLFFLMYKGNDVCVKDWAREKFADLGFSEGCKHFNEPESFNTD